jgi:hypothetical protein
MQPIKGVLESVALSETMVTPYVDLAALEEGECWICDYCHHASISRDNGSTWNQLKHLPEEHHLEQPPPSFNDVYSPSKVGAVLQCWPYNIVEHSSFRDLLA